MTDQTPRASACPDCRALIPATPDDRREHRAWHQNDRKAREALREALKDMRQLVSQARADLATAVTDLRREVGEIDIPAPVEPMVLEDWPEDEIDDDPNEVEDFPEDDDDEDIPHGPDGTFVTIPHAGATSPADVDDLEARIRAQTGGLA